MVSYRLTEIPSSDDCEKNGDFGTMLRNTRKARGFHTQADLGRAFRPQISPKEVSRWERNVFPQAFNARDVKQIAETMGCTDEEKAQLILAWFCYVYSAREGFE